MGPRVIGAGWQEQTKKNLSAPDNGQQARLASARRLGTTMGGEWNTETLPFPAFTAQTGQKNTFWRSSAHFQVPLQFSIPSMLKDGSETPRGQEGVRTTLVHLLYAGPRHSGASRMLPRGGVGRRIWPWFLCLSFALFSALGAQVFQIPCANTYPSTVTTGSHQ